MSGTLHIRYEGHSLDLSFNDLDIGDLSENDEVFQAVSRHLVEAGHSNATVSKLQTNFRIDRSEGNDNITLRPQASFG